MASITTLNEFTFVLGLAGDVQNNENLRIGLVSLDGANPSFPDNYVFVDGNSETEFFQTARSQFPWQEGEPSNGFNQRCVEFEANLREDNLWGNNNCNIDRGFVCRRPCAIITAAPVPETVVDPPTPADDPTSSENEPSGVAAIAIIIGVFIAIAVMLALDFRKTKKIAYKMDADYLIR